MKDQISYIYVISLLIDLDMHTIGCFFNSGFYALALIQSFFGILQIGRTFFHSIHRQIFKNAKTLWIGQILV